MNKRSYPVFILVTAGIGALLAASFVVHLALRQARIHTIEIETTEDLETFYEEIGYTLGSIRVDDRPVPSIDLIAFPDDWMELAGSPRRSKLFLRAILPLALFSNAAILEERKRLTALNETLQSAGTLSQGDRDWLVGLTGRYRVDPLGLDDDPASLTAELLLRVDAVPVSLVLAQAAIESGWGSSRFTHEGNALFGQWTFDGQGMIPEGGQRHGTNRVARFPELLSSVEAYMLNLNSHAAYEDFRRMRAGQQADGEALNGYALASMLAAYSETGETYTKTVQSLITQYNLTSLRDAKLDRKGPVYTLNP